MGLKQKFIGWAFGDTIRAEAQTQAREILARQVSSSGVDPDDHQWRGLLRSRRDLTPVDQDRLIEIANFLSSSNPLAALIVQRKTDFVIGDGLTFEAEDPNIQKILDDWWNDPVNNLDEYQFEVVKYLGVFGEIYIPTYVNEFSGAVRLGWIDPYEVEQVIADRHNRRIMRTVKMKPGASAGSAAFYDFSERRTYDVINVDTNPRSEFSNYRIGDIFQFRVNCTPDATRGRSDLESWADLADAWDQATFNDLERVQLLLNFIWDVKLTGMSPEEIEHWLEGQAPPRPGSIRAHNEQVEWEAEAPQLNTQETRKLSEGIRGDILGAAGFGPFFFGLTEGANRASAEALDLPILKGLMARQRKVRAIFKEFGDYAIDQAALHKRALKNQIESRSISRVFKVKMPELSTKDMTRIGGVVTGITTALDVATERNWIRQETAARIFAAIVQQFNIEYDVDEELKKAEVENETQDYTDERVEQLRAVGER